MLNLKTGFTKCLVLAKYMLSCCIYLVAVLEKKRKGESSAIQSQGFLSNEGCIQTSPGSKGIEAAGRTIYR